MADNRSKQLKDKLNQLLAEDSSSSILEPGSSESSVEHVVEAPEALSPILQRARARVNVMPILALAPSMVCGSLWFLYTFIGVFKYEGLGGIDFLTPIIVIGMPIAMRLFRKPIDKLLSPLDPIIRNIPMPLRFGIIFGMPLMLSCICSTVTFSGYSAMSFTSLVSIFVATILTRNVEVRT